MDNFRILLEEEHNEDEDKEFGERDKLRIKIDNCAQER